MARKSRKPTAIADATETAKFIFNAAIYARLSKQIQNAEDSIENQVNISQAYIKDKPYLKLDRIIEDVGKTGTNFDRDGFLDLMELLKSKKINCVVVKDLSRLGRDYIETGNLIFKVFPFLGVRFISVNDNYDSFNCNQEELIVALKNLMNDFHVKDLSRKITVALTTKRQNGEYIGTFAPYGYLCSSENKSKFIIDEKVADNVRLIFNRATEGCTYTGIAKELNKLNIPTPMNYFYSLGFVKHKKYAEKFYWKPETIKGILTNDVYIGHMVQGKYKSNFQHGAKGQKKQDINKRIIAYNTHEPIIDKELFDKAQEFIFKSKEKYDSLTFTKNKPNIFKGFVFCEKCGHNAKRYAHVSVSGARTYSFICVHCKSNPNVIEKPQYLSELELNTAIFNACSTQIAACIEKKKIIEKLNKTAKIKTRKYQIDDEVKEINLRLKKISSLSLSLYDDYAENLLSESEYLYAKEIYIKESEGLNFRLQELILEQELYKKSFVSENKCVTAFESFLKQKEVTKEMLDSLIDRIEINSKNINIFFKYRDEYIKLCEYVDKAVNLSA